MHEHATSPASEVRGAAPEVGSRAAWVPALATLVLGLSIVALRPPLPVDETRYLQVFRELGGRLGLVLHLNGELYAEKPPLLFWLAVLLQKARLPGDLPLRVLPALFTAGTVALAGRLGRRLGALHVGWIQASTLLPLLFGQAVYFDALLTFCVTASLVAWVEERDLLAAAAAGLALLAKGPVALLFLLPFLVALADRRRSGPSRKALASVLVASLVPLLAWAVAAAVRGGEEFARELFLGQTVGRIKEGHSHSRPVYTYLLFWPAVFLPWSPAILAGWRGLWRAQRRLVVAGLVTLLVLSAMSSKQPGYLLPSSALVSVLAAESLAQRPRRQVWGVGLAAVCCALLVAGVLVLVAGDDFLEKTGEYGAALRAGADWRATVVLAGLTPFALLLLLVRSRGRASVPVAAGAVLVGVYLALVPVHLGAGRLMIPERFVAYAREHRLEPLATLANPKGAYTNFLLGRAHVPELDESTLAEWCRENPGGYVWSKDAASPQELLDELGLVPGLQDRSRGKPMTLYRVPPAPRE